MRFLLATVLVCSLFFFNCKGDGNTNNDDDDQTPLLEQCFITEYTTDNGVTLEYIYNDNDLVEQVHYEVSNYSGVLNLTWDQQNRLTTMSFGSSIINITYGSNTIEATIVYDNTTDEGSGLIVGTGTVIYNVNSQGRVVNAVKDGQQKYRVEYNGDGQVTQLIQGPADNEEVYAEFLSYDDKINPFENLPIGFFVGSDNDQVDRLYWEFEPYETGKNNPTRILVNSYSGTLDWRFTHQYNELGYPLEISGPSLQQIAYNCK